MKRTSRVTVAVGLAVLLTAGLAAAAWVVRGAGTGTGRAATTDNLVVTKGTATGDLYPGSTGGDVFVQVRNPNSFPVDLTTATIAGPVTPTNCAVTISRGSFDLSAAAPVPAGATRSFTIPDALSMGVGADSSCQGLGLDVASVSVTGKSAP